MDDLTSIVSFTMTILRALTCLGIPLVIWEIFIILIKVVVRILFGASSKQSNTKED